jgi:hypothetical protein
VATGRYVLRYRGEGDKPAGDVAHLRAAPDATVVNESPKMVVVEGEPEALGRLVDSMPGWELLGPERTYEVPDTRKKITGPPE